MFPQKKNHSIFSYESGKDVGAAGSQIVAPVNRAAHTDSPVRLVPQTGASAINCDGNNGLDASADIFRCYQCPSRVYRSNAALNVHRRTIHGVLEYPSQSVPCQASAKICVHLRLIFQI